VIVRVLVRLTALFLLVYALGYAFFVVSLPQPAGDGRTDAVVVLTGGAGRIERGLDILRRRQAGRMLISGVQRTVRPQELAATHNVGTGIFDCCIDLGREAVDTRSNADEVAHWLRQRGFKSMRLITTDWHMPRARFEIEKRLEGEIAIVPDAVLSNPSLRQLFTEYNKYVLNRIADVVGI
jgi:uncharacterized SAM-binding protein YcdF (DUF218 family)